MSEPLFVEVRRAQAQSAIAAARRTHRTEIVRDGAIYRPQCCNQPMSSWHHAGQHVIEGNCQGETE